jgi:phospholipid/cholesterol/gamma-HCH transport system substrate-binding protein
VIRRSVKLQLIAFAIITIVGVSFVSARYVGLGDRLFGGGYVVTADFVEAGGIFTNAEVTYRGVAVGRVDRLRLANDGVHVDLRIKNGAKIPADTRAVVENRSAVGEQYVDLQPRHRGGPYLADGAHITKRDTATPVHTETVLLNLNRLVNSVDKRDLAVVIDQLGAAFTDSGRDLQAIIDSGDALTKEAVDALPETLRLIDDGVTVLDTQRASGSAIKSFSSDLADLSATLRSSDGDLRKVFDNGIVASQELDQLLRTNRADITALLANLLTTGQVTVARIDGLEQVLVTYPVNVSGGYTVVPGDGTSHFGLVLNASDPPACTKGYGGTKLRPPSDTSTGSTNTDARCTEPRGSKTSVRGAQNAPRPGNGSARSVPGGRAGTAPTGTEADQPGVAVSPSYVAGYDPTSGLAYGAGRAPLLFGASGGQHEAFGKDSWQWLLLGPLSK